MMTQDEIKEWRDRCNQIVAERNVNQDLKNNNLMISMVLTAVLQDD